MKRRRAESHVNERDENIKQLEEFHRVAKKQDDDSEHIIKLLENLHQQYNEYVKRYKQLFKNHRHDPRYRDTMLNNKHFRQQILQSIEELTGELETIENDRNWNLEMADDLLNHINGYSTSPAAFIGLGPFMDDEPNDEYGIPLSETPLAHISTYAHSGNPTTHQTWPANPFNN